MTAKLQAPFPYFGGKIRVADLVWERFGRVHRYNEPFAGSLAVLLAAPDDPRRVETVNDLDGMIANFWRAVSADAETVAQYADWPVNENDLHARHIWLVNRKESLQDKLEGDPHYYDPKIAGWWVWGISCWIGGGFCSGEGPWNTDGEKIVKVDTGEGVKRRLVHLGNSGQGVHKNLVHLGDGGRGVHKNRDLRAWFAALQARLRRVRVCCGDWSRVCGRSALRNHEPDTTAVFLDPPYSNDERESGVYSHDDGSVAADVRQWAIEQGEDKRMRIALCGYEGEHEMPPSWAKVEWKTKGGYGSQGQGRGRENQTRERIWFSPHCLRGKQGSLF